MKKKILTMALSMSLVLSTVILPTGIAYASETEGSADAVALTAEVSETSGTSIVKQGTCTDNPNISYTLDENGQLIIKGKGKIPKNAFSYWTDIYEVIIEPGVTGVEASAFSHCSNLQKVSLPNTLTIIGERAFEFTGDIESLSIPDSVVSLGKFAFSDSKMKHVSIGKGIKVISESAFQNTLLEEVVVPEGVLCIEDNAFGARYNASIEVRESLKSATIPNSVIKLGESAFTDRIQLATVNLGTGLSDVEAFAFHNTAWLKNLCLTNNGFGISGGVLFRYDRIINENVTIPSGVRVIADRAFDGWTDIKAVTIPSSVTTIGEYAFISCTNLESISIPSSVEQIGRGAFNNTKWRNDAIAEGGTFVVKEGILLAYNGNGGDVTIPSGVKTIDESVFQSKNLTSVTVPDSVVTLGALCFTDNSSLTSVKLGKGVKYIQYGALLNVPVSTITLPAGLKVIEERVFCGSGLTSITIPANTLIENNAFEGNPNLKNVKFTDGVSFIGANAFLDCMALNSVTIPDSVAYIGDKAFGFEYYGDKNTNLTLRGTKGLTAEQYANNFGFNFGEPVVQRSLSNCTATLSYTKGTYSGSAKKPVVTVKDENGKRLTKDDHYTVAYTNNIKPGKATVTIKGKGNYSGQITKTFIIVPKAVSSLSAKLYGYDDVKFSWTKTTGATGYAVYYKKASASKYTLIKNSTGSYVKKANLSDGVKYNFKVVPYKTIDGVKKYGASKYVSVYTLKKMAAPTVTRYSTTKVKVKWTNINGESGYQISKSTSKTGTNIVSTYGTTSGTYKTISATKGKTYYYKVRAYKTVDGKKIYGPWSAVKAYKRK